MLLAEIVRGLRAVSFVQVFCDFAFAQLRQRDRDGVRLHLLHQ